MPVSCVLSVTTRCRFVLSDLRQPFVCRQPIVICVRDDAEQLLDTISFNRCDDAKLRKMSREQVHKWHHYSLVSSPRTSTAGGANRRSRAARTGLGSGGESGH
jgi:hypothetical protein